MREFPEAHPNLSDEINHNIQNSAIEGGVYTADVPVGRGLRVQTRNTTYILRRILGNKWTIQGHPRYCPKAAECSIAGSTWGGSMLKVGFIGRGMHLEFWIRDRGTITTSQIQEIEEIP